MVWTIALLAVLNMAFGFAVAVYLQRARGTRPVSLPVAPLPPSVPLGAPTTPESQTASAPTAQSPDSPPEPEESLAATVSEVVAEASAATAVKDELQENPAITNEGARDEANVMAGIEVFRSQLARMSKASMEDDRQPEEKEPAEA